LAAPRLKIGTTVIGGVKNPLDGRHPPLAEDPVKILGCQAGGEVSAT